MSYLNSKICLSVKGSVYLSLLRLAQKMEFSPHTSRLLFHSGAPGILCSRHRNSIPQSRPVMAAGFSSVPTTCSVLFSLLCKRPTGKWGRQFTLACLCFAGSEQLIFLQDTQLSPPPEWRESCTEPARSARGNTSRSGKPANKLGRKAARRGPQREEIIQSAKSR